MSYPYSILRSSYQRGNKSRYLISIQNNEGEFRGLLIKRYSVGTAWGGVEVESFSQEKDLTAAVIRFSTDLQDYRRKPITNAAATATNASELKRVLGPMWYKMGKENIEFLDPAADVTGVKEPIRFEKQGDRYVPVPPPPRLVEEPPPAPKSVREQLATNPNWGSF